MRFGHVGISVSNIRRSSAFYCKHFGLKRDHVYRHPELGMTIVILARGDITVELFEFKQRKPLPGYRRSLARDLRTLGVKHFSVEVFNIEAVYRKFKAGKVPLATDICVFSNGKRYFFIKDPDGILVEIMEA